MAGRAASLCGLDVAEDIPLGLGPVRLGVIELAVPAIYRPSHKDQSFQLAESRRVPVNRRAQIRFRANGDQGDLTWVQSYLVQKEVHGIRVGLVRTSVFCIPSLAQRVQSACWMLRDAHVNGNV